MMRMYGPAGAARRVRGASPARLGRPVVTWWHGATPEKLAYDALGVLASRRVTDATTEGEDALAALKRRAKDYAPGDSDLAWTRTTPWRALARLGLRRHERGDHVRAVHAQHGNPSAALLAGWLTARLGVRVKRVDSPDRASRGGAALPARAGLRIDRPDGYLATLSRTGISDRQLPLKRRELGDLLAEELRRLDADQPYADSLSAVTGEKGLDERPPMRTLIWRDPAAGPLPTGSRAKPRRPPRSRDEGRAKKRGDRRRRRSRGQVRQQVSQHEAHASKAPARKAAPEEEVRS
jgi:hypothetical protein